MRSLLLPVVLARVSPMSNGASFNNVTKDIIIELQEKEINCVFSFFFSFIHSFTELPSAIFSILQDINK